MKKTTIDRIILVIACHYVLDPADLDADTVLSELGGDSLDVVEVEMELEEEFDVDIDDFDRCKTIGDLESKITTLLGL